jgi:hypothetical protein
MLELDPRAMPADDRDRAAYDESTGWRIFARCAACGGWIEPGVAELTRGICDSCREPRTALAPSPSRLRDAGRSAT